MIPAKPEAFKLFHHGVQALSRVECAGMRVDMDYLDTAIAKVGDRIDYLDDKLKRDKVWDAWRRRYGQKASLTSRPQLGVVLFEELGYEAPGINLKSGRYKANAEALETVDLDFVRSLVQVEKLRKLQGTYLKGLKRAEVDGFVHAFYQLHKARTYRSSGEDPNLQNIPIRDPQIGKIIRRAFRSRWKEGRLCEIDFSAIEVRVAACYHRDPVMLKYIEDDYDMHLDMAAECYLLDKSEVQKPIRHAAKNSFVFPEFYGSTYTNVAPGLWGAVVKNRLKLADGTSLLDHMREQGIEGLGECHPKKEPVPGTFEQHIQQIEQGFWKKRFKVYDRWRWDWYSKYLRKGGFETLTGFAVNGMLKRNDVINYPVQGSAFHCLLWALVTLQNEMIKRGMKTQIICQIHDSILADVYPGEFDDYVALAVDVMTRRLREFYSWIICPIGVEVEACEPGGTWHDKKKVMEAR